MINQSSHYALYTVEQVRRIDRIAIDSLGIPGIQLMQRAADAAFAALLRRWPKVSRIAVLAGNGNNGGDAFLVAQRALALGFEVNVLSLSASSSGDAELARNIFIKAGGSISVIDASTEVPECELIVDGLFGTGISRALDVVPAKLVDRINLSDVPVLALDVPSGLDADTGRVHGTALRADLTVSFVGWKRGLFTADAVDYCGELELATLDIPHIAYAEIEPDGQRLSADLRHALTVRKRNVNKGVYGHVLAIGGDEGMAGAVRLAAEAALRLGSGLVSVATRGAHISALNAARPELMAHGIEGPQALEPLLARASVIALGPGLGQRAWGHALWDAALRSNLPTVLDADALNLLAIDSRCLPETCVLTPHPGEAARLLGCDIETVQRDRFAAARELAARYRAVVVLKGAGTIIADASGRWALCPFGNPGMASGGMGDVLTGAIAALIAQGLDAWDAARLGVVAHAIAADNAAGKSPRGLLASDLFQPLREFINGASA